MCNESCFCFSPENVFWGNTSLKFRHECRGEGRSQWDIQKVQHHSKTHHRSSGLMGWTRSLWVLDAFYIWNETYGITVFVFSSFVPTIPSIARDLGTTGAVIRFAEFWGSCWPLVTSPYVVWPLAWAGSWPRLVVWSGLPTLGFVSTPY